MDERDFSKVEKLLFEQERPLTAKEIAQKLDITHQCVNATLSRIRRVQKDVKLIEGKIKNSTGQSVKTYQLKKVEVKKVVKKTVSVDRFITLFNELLYGNWNELHLPEEVIK